MRVLLLETEAGVADDAAARLSAAGHDVVRCHEPHDRDAFPCQGVLDTACCPIEGTGAGVDVALTVRHAPSPVAAPLEDGIACAIRARVPVVVAGEAASNPYEAFGAVVAGDDLVAACEAAATGPLDGHGSVAQHALEASLAAHGLRGIGERATVYRSRGGLRVVLSLFAPVDEMVLQQATTRVVGALRTFDRMAPRIDVSVER